MPTYSLIGVYGDIDSQHGAVLRRALGKFKFVVGTEVEESQLSAYLKQYLNVTGEENHKGIIFHNFPATVQQANQFDDLTDGLNLAISFERPQSERHESEQETSHTQDSRPRVQTDKTSPASYYDQRVK